MPTKKEKAEQPLTEVMNKDLILHLLTTPDEGPDAGSIAFSSNAILFGYGSAKLREASYPQLMEIAKALNDPAVSAVPFFFVDGTRATSARRKGIVPCPGIEPVRWCSFSWKRAACLLNASEQEASVRGTQWFPTTPKRTGRRTAG